MCTIRRSRIIRVHRSLLNHRQVDAGNAASCIYSTRDHLTRFPAPARPARETVAWYFPKEVRLQRPSTVSSAWRFALVWLPGAATVTSAAACQAMGWPARCPVDGDHSLCRSTSVVQYNLCRSDLQLLHPSHGRQEAVCSLSTVESDSTWATAADGRARSKQHIVHIVPHLRPAAVVVDVEIEHHRTPAVGREIELAHRPLVIAGRIAALHPVPGRRSPHSAAASRDSRSHRPHRPLRWA